MLIECTIGRGRGSFHVVEITYGTEGAEVQSNWRNVGAASDAGNRALEKNIMNWIQIEGQWHRMTGLVKSKWAELTDDDLKSVAGKKDQLIGNAFEKDASLSVVERADNSQSLADK